MYKVSRLLWVKNVKRGGGTGWAYDEFNVGDIFPLNWPKRFKGNVLKPAVGDSILIFQSINNPYGTYLTHIVTPITDEIVEVPESTHPYTRMVGVLAKANPMNLILKPDDLDFYRPRWGNCCRLSTIVNIKTKKEIRLSILQNRIWELFREQNLDLESTFSATNLSTDADESFLEGERKNRYYMHKYYERNVAAVRKKKELAIKKGILICEVCSFDFSLKYPGVGNGFIECHHKTPLSAGITRNTTIDDLALVCSNCHRMLHKLIEGENLSIDDLKTLIGKSNVRTATQN